MTLRDLVTRALYKCNAYGPSEPIEASDAQLGLDEFNSMVDSSNTTRANIFTESITQLNLIPNQQKYTIGPGGDFNRVRPIEITRANVLLSGSGVGAIRQPLLLMNDAQWAEVILQGVYSIPQGVYNDGDNPLSMLYFWPIPDQIYPWEFYEWQANAKATSLNSLIQFPPGYEEFWLYGLTVRLAEAFGRPLSAMTLELWRQAEMNVRNMNSTSPLISNDALLNSKQSGLYNYKSGLVQP